MLFKVYLWFNSSFTSFNMCTKSSVPGHPYEPILAVSGIDHTIKIFSPDARAQEDAKNGINISSATHGSHGYSSLSYSTRRRRSDNTEIEDAEPQAGEGLASRKCMDQSYQIMSRNDVERKGGMRDALITVGPFPALRRMEVGFVEWLSWFGS